MKLSSDGQRAKKLNGPSLQNLDLKLVHEWTVASARTLFGSPEPSHKCSVEKRIGLQACVRPIRSSSMMADSSLHLGTPTSLSGSHRSEHKGRDSCHKREKERERVVGRWGTGASHGEEAS
jgi:hypothetical protein